jgi:hypothetical protein
VLEGTSYVPTLAVRASEMNGLEFLPAATKDRMAPCFLLAPWPNSHSLEKAIIRIEKAFHNRQYLLDIDRDYIFTNLENEGQREFADLLNPTNAFENWRRFVADHEWVLPCVQTRGQSQAEILQQIRAFQEMGRPYFGRIVLQRFPDNFSEIVSAFAASGSADFAILLEGGWTVDPLTLSAWFAGLISGGLQTIDANVPAIVSCTSIPKLFSAYNSRTPATVGFTNRQLVEQVARTSNRARLIYGDWGSTRPREDGGIASRPIERIDYPSSTAWHIARNKDEAWGFQRASEAIIGDPAWDPDLGIWGIEMITNTAINPALGINTPQKNVASRVNIHLHRQAFFGADMDRVDFDEDWED